MESGIYKIQNRWNGKSYVGSAVNIPKRWKAHLRDLSQGVSSCRKLQRAWNKWGPDCWDFTVLELVEVPLLAEAEERWITLLDTHRVGYNCSVDGRSARGVVRSQEFKERARESGKLRYQNNLNWYQLFRDKAQTPEAREKRKLKLIGRRRPPFSEEWRERISYALLGRHQDPEWVEKRVSQLRGKKRPEGSVQKGVATRVQRGSYAWSDEGRSKLSESFYAQSFEDQERALGNLLQGARAPKSKEHVDKIIRSGIMSRVRRDLPQVSLESLQELSPKRVQKIREIFGSLEEFLVQFHKKVP